SLRRLSLACPAILPDIHPFPTRRSSDLLELGQELEDDPVLVVGSVDRRDLARAVGAVERVLELLRSDAQRRRALAVDPHPDLGVLDLEVAGHVVERRLGLEPRLEARAVLVKRRDVGALQRELVLALGEAAPDPHRRW